MWISRVAVWGDSITYGAGDEDALGWVGQLRARLETDHATEVYNRGICGNTSNDVLARFDTECKAIKPGLIVIAIGTNDSVFRNGMKSENEISKEGYIKNIESIHKIASLYTKKIYFVGLTDANDALAQPVAWSTTGKSYETAILMEYDDVLRDKASELEAGYISMRDALSHEDLFDGLHPNKAGYQKMYLRIHEALKDELV